MISVRFGSRCQNVPRRRRNWSIAVATQALVMRTSTPVAYAPPWASTFARKSRVTVRLIAVKRYTSGRTARAHSGAMPYFGRYCGTRFSRPTIALAPANQRMTTVLTS
jgi:hypothetical protein